VGIAPNQPYPGSSFRWQSVVIMAVCAVAALVFGVGAFFQGGKRIADFPVTARDYGQEYVTDSFKVTQPDTVCELDMRMQATNAWAYLDVALLDDQDRALLDFSAEVSYYEGVEGGEHWTEGSRSTSKVFKVDQPGAYRLLLLGQGGDRGSPDVRLSITEGVTLARYYFLIFLFSVGWIVAVIGHRVWFEAKRWSPVLEGDDDDD